MHLNYELFAAHLNYELFAAAFTVDVSLGNLISIGVFVIGFAVTWGKYQALIKTFGDSIDKMEKSIKDVNVEVTRLNSEGSMPHRIKTVEVERRLNRTEQAIETFVEVHSELLTIKKILESMHRADLYRDSKG